MDNSPTSLFDSYESDFKQIISSIKGKLDGDAKEQKGGWYRMLEIEIATDVLRYRRPVYLEYNMLIVCFVFYL